jgi:transcriptional regulator with XRE-family HTH domain
MSSIILNNIYIFLMKDLIFMKNLKKIRKARGLSQQELANKSKLKKSLISYYENNAVNPPFDKIEIIAKVLNVTIGDLLNNKNIDRTTDYNDIDPRILKKVIKIQSLTLKDQKKIWDYIETIITNHDLELKQKKIIGS